MADKSAQTPEPIKKWAYPFEKKAAPNAKDAKASEVTDPQTYFEALATAEDGFYPIGANGLWHGGVHFGSQTGNTLSQDDGVRCIADGEVIAYRIDSAYPQVEYECGKATYSKGFVLLKHRLQLPPAPKKAAADAKEDDKATTPAKAGSEQAAEEPTLTFFSLYMHLLDWAGYEADKKRSRPAYWDGEKQYVVSSKSNDKEEKIAPGATGLRIRDADNKPIAILPNGTRLTLGEEGAKKGYFAIASIISGSSVPAGQSTGYVYKKELEVIATPKTKDAVAVLDKPEPIQAGELIGYPGQYQRYVDVDAMACSDRPLAHVEVFSSEDVQGFMDKSKVRGKELDAKQKTLLVVDKGSALVLPAGADQSIAAGVDVQLSDDSPKAGRWAKVQSLASTPAPTKKNPNAVKLAPTGEVMWVERTLLNDKGQRASTGVALDAWSRFPLQVANATGPTANYLRVAAIKTLKTTATDDKGVRWWEIDVDTPDASGNTLGWACETGHLQSPWEWPGFEIVSETAMLVDQHGKQIIDERLDTPADKDDFKAKAERAKEGALFQKLYDVIDLDKSESLTTNELRTALRKPWLAQTISRVIARYESEWGGNTTKWDELDGHMGEKAKDWGKEKGRIKELQWWGELAGKHGFPSLATANHFHPVGLISNFGTTTELITLEMLESASSTGSKDYHEKILPYLNMYAVAYEVNTPLRIAHFLAQVGHESGFKVTSESGNYSAKRMREVYGCKGGMKRYNKKTDDCDLGRLRDKLWSDEDTYANNAENLFSYVYADRMGNGDEASKEGYKYRGRGIIQLTGKYNYTEYTRIHNQTNPDDPRDFAVDPDLIVNNIQYGIESAFVYCEMNNFNAAADKDDVRATTRIVNGGDNGLADRIKHLKELKIILGI